MLVELGVVEQRHAAVLEVLSGVAITVVAARYGISRQTVHRWLRRYGTSGLAGLADRSSRPASCPHQLPPHLEARIGELRGEHPGWGPRTILHRLSLEGAEPLPSRSSVYRCLVRHRLIEPRKRRKKRSEYRRWERARAMELWQMDVMGGVRLADGRELKMVTGIDDHSRFCVCARLTARATARPLCEAFAAAVARYGAPEQVLTDNGKVFTARFGVGSGEVLFDRLCRENGIRHLLTAPRSPTTTGKVERFHKTIRKELLVGRRFASLESAQEELDAWIEGYNRERPHQGIGMLPPAERFAPASARTPAVAAVAAAPPPAAVHSRRVSPEGRISFADRRYQIGAWLAGETVELRCRDGLLEVSHRGVLVASLARREPTPPQETRRPPAPQPLRPPTAGRPVLRKVDPSGKVSFAGVGYCVGHPYRGQRVEVRLVGDRVEIAQDARLLKSWPARHDPFKEHGAFSTPAGRPQRSNASRFTPHRSVTELPKPTRNTGGET